MTDYTERFRTLSIQQLQQVCALLCEGQREYLVTLFDNFPEKEHLPVEWPHQAFDRRLAAILAPDNRIESAHPISREANRQLPSTGETATVSDNSDKRPPHEVAFASLSPVPIAELVRGIGPAYWHELGFEQGREYERSRAARDALSAPKNNVIRSGDLVAGKRYRVVSGEMIDSVFICQDGKIDASPTEPGHIDNAQNTARRSPAWFAVREDGYGGWVTAVELVEDELEKSLRHVAPEGETNGLRMGDSTTQGISVSAAHGLEREGNAPVPGGTPELHSEGDQGKSRNRSEVRAGDLHVHGSAEASTGMACEPSRHASDGLGASDGVDPTIIRAAEGVTLEPGEYEIVAINDTHPRLKVGDIARPENCQAVQQIAPQYKCSYAWLFLDGGPSTWVTAVRRVDQKPDCARCGGSGSIPNGNDEMACGSCAGSGIARVDPKPASEPVAPAAGEKCDWCIRCTGRLRMMCLCPTCGNKRCPKATYHANLCSGSNEPGQPGSDYTAPPQQPAERVEPVVPIDEFGRVVSERATVAKLTAELESMRITVRAAMAAVELQDSELRKRRVRIRELEAAHVAIDAKTCGELIEKIRAGIGTGYVDVAGGARQALDTLSGAMARVIGAHATDSVPSYAPKGLFAECERIGDLLNAHEFVPGDGDDPSLSAAVAELLLAHREMTISLTRLTAELETEEREHERTLKRRDELEDKLDAFVLLAGGEENCGEHSSSNDPWRRAYEHFEQLAAAKARVAELEQAHCEQVAEREHLEEGARLLRALHALDLVKHEAYHAALDRWLEAQRLRQAKPIEREARDV